MPSKFILRIRNAQRDDTKGKRCTHNIDSHLFQASIFPHLCAPVAHAFVFDVETTTGSTMPLFEGHVIPHTGGYPHQYLRSDRRTREQWVARNGLVIVRGEDSYIAGN